MESLEIMLTWASNGHCDGKAESGGEMIFGDGQSFAMHAEADAVSQPTDPDLRFVYGRFAFIVGGKVVGNFDDGCSLSVAAHACAAVLRHTDRRVSRACFTLSAKSAFSKIHRALFDDDSRTDEEVARDEAQYRRYLIAPPFDAFDTWHVYLMECGELERVLWTREGALEVHQQTIRAGEVGRTLSNFVAWFERNHPSSSEGGLFGCELKAPLKGGEAVEPERVSRSGAAG